MQLKSVSNINLFLSVFILIFSNIIFHNGPGSVDNHEQWMNLTNQIFYSGNDFLFSYGPLYWLVGGTTTHFSLVTYLASWGFLAVTLSAFWFFLLKVSIETDSILYLSLVFVVFIPGLIFHQALYLWPFSLILYFTFCKHRMLGTPDYLLLGALVALSFYLRFFWGVFGLAVLGSFLVIDSVAKRQPQLAAWFFGALVATFILIGFCIFDDWRSIYRYVAINRALSLGNSIDMVLEAPRNEAIWIPVVIALISLCGFTVAKRPKLLVAIIAYCAVSVKLGFGRVDHYVGYFLAPMAILLLLPLVDRSRWGYISAAVGATSLAAALVIPAYQGDSARTPISVGTDFSIPYQERMAKIYQQYELPADIIELIGSNSVDVFPYNNEYIFANKLNYQRRPLFQSYMTLTPELGDYNKQFLVSEDKPDFILWTAGFWCVTPCNPFSSFDGKYSLWEDPTTVAAILAGYSPVATALGKGGVPIVLMRANHTTENLELRVVDSGSYEFDRWYNIPDFSEGLLYFSPQFKFTELGRLQNLFLWGEILHVHLSLPSGGTVTYRANVLNASDGLAVSPFLDSFDFGGQKPNRIKLSISNKTYMKRQFEAAWLQQKVPFISPRRINEAPTISSTVHCLGSIDSLEGRPFRQTVTVSETLDISGWLATEGPTGVYEEVLVLVRDRLDPESSFFYPVLPVARSDVATHLSSDAALNSGFVSRINLAGFSGRTLDVNMIGINAGNESYSCENLSFSVSVSSLY